MSVMPRAPRADGHAHLPGRVNVVADNEKIRDKIEIHAILDVYDLVRHRDIADSRPIANLVRLASPAPLRPL